MIIPSSLFEASSGIDASIAAGSNARQPLVRIAELVELEPAPLHEAKEQAAHPPVGSIEVVEHSSASEFAPCAAEQDDRQVLGIVVAVEHARAVRDCSIVEQCAIPFLDLRHSLAEVSKLGHEELVEGDKLCRLGVGHLVMLIFGTAVRVGFGGAVVAILEGRDPGGVGTEGQQHDVVHEFPIVRDLSGNAIGGSRAIRGGQARGPASGLALLAGTFDATLDLVNAAKVLLEPLPVRYREPLP